MSALKILVLIDLIQDIDVLLPVLIGLRAAPAVQLEVLVSDWLFWKSPRTSALLRRHGLGFRYISRRRVLAGAAPRLGGIDALLTAAESTAGPHRWAHALALRARETGIATFTIQHGLDNIRALSGPVESRIRFASEVLFCWGGPSSWPDDLDSDVRRRLAPVGRALLPRPPVVPTFDVGLFENLHAKHYSDADRQRIGSRLLETIRSLPHRHFYLRSHPAGGWLDDLAPVLRRFANATLSSSTQGRRDLIGGAAAAAQVSRVITTPSTVALDAAMAGRAVALSIDCGALYRPLPVLSSLEDWVEFAGSDLAAGHAEADFLVREVEPGDATARIVNRLATL